MIYKHTQKGYFMLFIIFFIVLVYWYELLIEGFDYITLIIIVFVLFFVGSFSSLTIIVDRNDIIIQFGYGLIKKKIPINDVTKAEIVKNKFFYGYGIRYLFWKKTTLYNISGFKAVELKMKSGKFIRIGTNEPEKLKRVISEQIN